MVYLPLASQHFSVLESADNVRQLGITDQSVSPGGEHSKSLHNRIVTSILLNQDYDRDSVERLIQQQCMKTLGKVALVEIALTGHDVIEITSQTTWSLQAVISDIGGVAMVS